MYRIARLRIASRIERHLGAVHGILDAPISLRPCLSMVSHTLQMSSDFAECRGITIDIEGPYVGNILSLKQLILKEA